ncbi:MAG: TerB family tellurite resistance protein [Polyangiaceae bacterium]|nr:TerB family tellurite resistance protein [Myxococcales bacterium]MCB9590260.1 TerB family tellurite resistance protein [Polyangiaceae bacterium]MCB9605085.1 TerB family tellurite resistance protein [Polyangiaceae bacterium]
MHDQNMAILKGLCAVAWADGRVAEEEKEVIEALLEAFGASKSEAAEIRAYAATEKKLEDVPVTQLSYDDRRALLQHAVLLTYIDGEQADSELKMLEALCEVLHIPSAEASGIMTAASERAKKLLNLLD